MNLKTTNMIGIYKITSPLNEVYIGQSTNIEKRFYSHKFNSSNESLKNSLLKYGIDTHTFEVIEECSLDVLLERERYFIELYKSDFVIFNSENVGGKRDNAGRKKGIETGTIRIPSDLKAIIQRYIRIKTIKK